MLDISQVFAITTPIFIIIGIGYFAVKLSLMAANTSQVLSQFVVNFALPALLFQAISSKPVAQVFNAVYLLGYAGGSLLAFFALYFISRRLRGKSISHSAIFAMGGSFSNNLMIGYPVVIQLFGPVAMVPLALTLMVENFIMFPLTLLLANQTQGGSKCAVLLSSIKRVLSNPIILSIILGVGFSYFSIKLPSPALKVIDLMANAASAVALFSIGGLLVGIKMRSVISDIAYVLPVKLVLHPLLVLLVFWLLPGVQTEMLAPAIVLASMPMFGIYPLVASPHGLGRTCAAILMATTLSAFISINLILWLVGQYLPGFAT